MFEDEFIDKEDNAWALDGMLRFLTKNFNDVQIVDNSSKDDQYITEYHRVPDTSSLSENLWSCL